MKKIFIPVEDEREIKIPDELRNRKIGILWTKQHEKQARKLKGLKGGAVLGCNASNALKIKDKVECYFLVSDGRFHALEIARKTRKEVYVSDGGKIRREEIDDYEKKLKGRQMKFLDSEKKGVLISLKPGQKNFKLAEKLREKYDAYVFANDELDIDSLENFSDIDIFINTACPRIEGKKIINFNELP